MAPPSFDWTFPLPTCHHGLLLGNGLMGALVWGEGRTLRVTVGRADYWDHRGGMAWTDEMTFGRIRQLLEAGDEAGLRAIFERKDANGNRPMRPTILPVGRVEFTLPADLVSARLDPHLGVATVVLANGAEITLEMAPRDPVVLMKSGAGELPCKVLASGDYAAGSFGDNSRAWQERGLPAPEPLERLDAVGFVQALPADPALVLACRWSGGDCYVVTERGADASAAVTEAVTLLANAIKEGPERFAREARQWWAEFWQQVPKVSVPNPTLQFLLEYGLYKFGASTNPRGVPCGLQGPWIEDDRLPAWSADYHFNINVQMCYGPGYGAGLGRHFRPLWKMLRSWEGELRKIARTFAGIGDGMMMPHAVDDRGTNMGGFWTGTIDHGCTAWVAKMMFDAWDYGFEDDTFLAETVYPWLVGTINVYRAMSERKSDGTYTMPVTVSPEYRGSAMNAWGADASFQLAAAHATLNCLEAACRRLGRPFLEEWAEYRRGLPGACVQGSAPSGWADRGGDMIMLWRGTPLEESHRHHSHLAGITPFGTIDPMSEQWKAVVEKSLSRWIEKGMGWWSGWCLSWASQIHTRVGNASAAEYILESFYRFFCNEGHGTFHNCTNRGFTLMGGGAMHNWNWQAMQLDGGQGSCTAVMDMLAHERRGTVCLFAGCPADWEEVSFERLHLPGGFRVSAKRTKGKLTNLHVYSARGGKFRYQLHTTGEVHAIDTTPGSSHEIVSDR